MTRADTIRFVTFYLDQVVYGVEVQHLQEVLWEHEVAPVPLADPSILGLMNLRGQVVTALDLRHLLGHAKRTLLTDASLHVVVEHREGLVSLLVDSYGNYVERPRTVYKPPPSVMSPHLAGRLSGFCELEDRKIVMILNVETLFCQNSNPAESKP